MNIEKMYGRRFCFTMSDGSEFEGEVSKSEFGEDVICIDEDDGTSEIYVPGICYFYEMEAVDEEYDNGKETTESNKKQSFLGF